MKALGLSKKREYKPKPLPVLEEEVKPEEPKAPVMATEVQLGSFKIPDLFELKGERYRVADKGEHYVVVTKLQEFSYELGKTMWKAAGNATLADYTMVKPIK